MSKLLSLLATFLKEKEQLHPEGDLIEVDLYADDCSHLKGSDGWSSWQGKEHSPHPQFVEDVPVESWRKK